MKLNFIMAVIVLASSLTAVAFPSFQEERAVDLVKFKPYHSEFHGSSYYTAQANVFAQYFRRSDENKGPLYFSLHRPSGKEVVVNLGVSNASVSDDEQLGICQVVNSTDKSGKENTYWLLSQWNETNKQIEFYFLSETDVPHSVEDNFVEQVCQNDHDHDSTYLIGGDSRKRVTSIIPSARPFLTIDLNLNRVQ